MRCRDIMKTDVIRCTEESSVQDCAQLMRNNNVGFLPVVDASLQVVGVITDRDLAVRILANDRPPATRVGDVMTRDVRICRADEDLQAAEWKMASNRKSRLVVADDEGRCVGVISLSDVAHADDHFRAGGVLSEVTRRMGSARPRPS